MYTLFGDDNKVLEVSSSEVKWVLLSGLRIIEYLSEASTNKENNIRYE